MKLKSNRIVYIHESWGIIFHSLIHLFSYHLLGTYRELDTVINGEVKT